MTDQKPSWIKRNLIYIILGFLLLVTSGFGLFNHNNKRDAIDALRDVIKEKDSLAVFHAKRSEIRLERALEAEEHANLMREENDQLRFRNYRLQNEIKKNVQAGFVIDTSFIINAKRITDGVNKFYEGNNDLR